MKRTIAGPFLVLALMVAGMAVAAVPAGAQGDTVVINEVYYNPPDDDDGDAEFVELHNPGGTDIDLTGYTFDDDGSAAAGTTATLSGTLEAGGYVILTPTGYDAEARWGITPLGTLDFGLSGGGDTLTLRDADGDVVDEVTYDDAAPWPTAADGAGPSIELIDSSSDNSLPGSWADSDPLPTPGMINSVNGEPQTPTISGVVATPSEPNVNQNITVVATVPGGGPDPVLHYVVGFGAESTVTMNDAGAGPDVTAGDGVFTATIPGQAAGELVRYRITSAGPDLEYPTGDDRNYHGVVVDDPGEIPTGLTTMEWFIPEVDYNLMFDDPTIEDVIVFGSVLAIDGVVYDNMEVKIRGGGFPRANR